MSSRQDVRKTMRRRRRGLSEAERQAAAQGLGAVVGASDVFRRSRRIALYLANDGEIDPAPLALLAWRRLKQCLLPMLHGPAFNRLWFGDYEPGTVLVPNRYGIPEPALPIARAARPLTLDLALVPLVAFDGRGHRLGMGGGFYDRTFAYLKNRRHWRKPYLLGVAYDFQEVDALAAESWDVPLHGIATESRFIDFKTH